MLGSFTQNTLETAPAPHRRIGLGRLFEQLARILDRGHEPIAKLGATALRRAASTARSVDMVGFPGTAKFEPVLDQTADPDILAALKPVFSHLNWHHSGHENGRIPEQIALRMLTCELIGPDGLVRDHTCRVGLFAQDAHLDYPARTHSAEELFAMIAGDGFWRRSDEPEMRRQPGDRIHHRSYEPHASRTGASPLVAIWAWAGDIDFASYHLNESNTGHPLPGRRRP